VREIANMAWRHTSRRQGRTTLTVLGIAIGFGAIIAILSLSFGVKQSVEASFSPIATDAIVLPVPRETYDSSQGGQPGQGGLSGGGPGGARRPQTRTRIESGYIDSSAFQKIINTTGVVDYVARSAPISLSAIWQGREIQMVAVAIDPEQEADLGQIALDSGSWPGDMEALGGQILQRISQISEGSQITVVSEDGETHVLTVRGLVGTSREARFGAPPNIPLFINFETASLFTDQERYSTLIVSAESRAAVKEVADSIQAGHPNLTVLTFDDFTEAIESTLNQYSLFLLSIGILAVAVAALGSANTMVVSTMERTREIGIMKATGAKSSFVLKGFLIESALLGLVGGLIGVIFGYLGSQILEYMVVRLDLGRIGGAASGFSPYIPLWLIPFSILLAIAVTVISGSYPALRASRLDPVEAIRFE
jgi:putative ABC transport system permease protein